jgi:hypothetical protein
MRDVLDALVLTCFVWGVFFALGGSVLAYATGEAIAYVIFASGLAMLAVAKIAHATATVIGNKF